MIDMYLYDDEEQSQVQFVGFVGEHSRYDLMLVQTDRHYGKTLVLNMQTNKFGIIGTDDIEEEGYIAHILGVSQEESDEIIEYLNQVIQYYYLKSCEKSLILDFFTAHFIYYIVTILVLNFLNGRFNFNIM